MQKSYVIPIDDLGLAYLGVKALTNPYRAGGEVFCRGCPSIFGGNVDTGHAVEDTAAETLHPAAHSEADTLYQEARQESHYKIDLNQHLIRDALIPGSAVNAFRLVCQAQQNNGDPMRFYVLRGNFVFDPAPFTSRVVLDRNPFKETTGDIVKFPLLGQNFPDAHAAAAAAVAAMPGRLRDIIPPPALDQFYGSHSAEALRSASVLA